MGHHLVHVYVPLIVHSLTTQVFSFISYEYHLDSALVKPTQERWLKLQDLMLHLKSKHVDVANWVAHLNGEDGPGGKPSHEVLPVSPQGALEISSVIVQTFIP